MRKNNDIMVNLNLNREDYINIENKVKDILFSYNGKQNTRAMREELQDRLYYLFSEYGLEDELKIWVKPYSIEDGDTNVITLVGCNCFSKYFLMKIFEGEETNYFNISE